MNLLSAQKREKEVKSVTLLAVHKIRQEQEQEMRKKLDRKYKLTCWRAYMIDEGQREIKDTNY